jgi:1-deoxyxylulose-5-phosphate synthase
MVGRPVFPSFPTAAEDDFNHEEKQNMDRLNRREFVEKAVAAAGAITVAGALSEQAAAGQESKADKTALTPGEKIRLGKTGIQSSIVGIGTGSVGWNHQSNQTRLGQEKFNALIRHAYDNGIHFFDLADQYGSMPFFREPLKKLPREKIVIQSKSNSRTPDKMRADLDRFRKELNTDYIDTLLVHCVTEADWNTRYRGVMDVLEEARQKGIIRAHGVSCHTLESLEAASTEPWVQVDLARFNPWGKYMDGKQGEPESKAPDHVRPLLQKMRKAGKGVIGMKIVAQGDVMKEADRLAKARESIRHALITGAVDMMVIGFETHDQITEIMKETRVALAEVGYRFA